MPYGNANSPGGVNNACLAQPGICSSHRSWQRLSSPAWRRLQNDRGDGPRSTPTIDGDRVYVFGSSGDLSVLDAATGKVFWTENLLRKFGGSNIPWGLSESPLVLSDRIIVT